MRRTCGLLFLARGFYENERRSMTEDSQYQSKGEMMSAVFVCLLNHANHDLSSQTARRTRLSILSGSLIDSLVVTGTRRHVRTRPYARGRHISGELRDVNIFIRHRRTAVAR